MTYRAADADANTGDSDAAIRTFTITVQAAGDFAPRMYGTVASQTYTAGTAIVPLRLPTAYGGDGALTYTLAPAVPGFELRRRHAPSQRHAGAAGHLPDDLPGGRRRRQHRGQRRGHPHLHHHRSGGARRRSGPCARVRLRDSVRQTGRRAALHLRRDGSQSGRRGVVDVSDVALLLLPGRVHLHRRQGRWARTGWTPWSSSGRADETIFPDRAVERRHLLLRRLRRRRAGREPIRRTIAPRPSR